MAGRDPFVCSTQGSDGCGWRFASLRAFDAHLLRHANSEKAPDCRDEGWMTDHGWTLNEYGEWFDPASAAAAKARFSRRRAPRTDLGAEDEKTPAEWNLDGSEERV